MIISIQNQQNQWLEVEQHLSAIESQIGISYDLVFPMQNQQIIDIVRALVTTNQDFPAKAGFFVLMLDLCNVAFHEVLKHRLKEIELTQTQ